MAQWLSLLVSPRKDFRRKPGRPKIVIAAPSTVVRFATRRNRIRRLIKEAVRRDPFFRAEAEYFFKVRRAPESPDLRTVEEAIREAKK